MSEEMKNLNNEQPSETPVEKVEPKVEAKKPLDKKTIGIIAGVAAAVVVLIVVLAIVLGGGKDPVPTLNDYTLGMGIVVDLGSSKEGNAQVDATVATVVLDKDGKIVLCRIDAVQNKAALNEDGTFTIKNLKTKMELGDDYGMAGKVDGNNDGVKLEWYEQAKAFEKHVIGMTGEQVANMETAPNFMNYQMSTDEALLAAGCTIQITDFKAAVAKACKDDQSVSFKSEGNFTLGVAANSFDDNSSAASADEDGVIKMYADFAASVVEDGKIVASLNDAIQPNISFNLAGEVTTSFKATKRELKEGYGMAGKVDANNDGVKLEWYEQSKAFSAHVVGMTAEQVANMETAPNFMNYQMSTDDALLSAGCTIQITAIKAVVAESVTNAR